MYFPEILSCRKNGFTLEEDHEAPPGSHFRLKAVPFSKNITFGVEGTCQNLVMSNSVECH